MFRKALFAHSSTFRISHLWLDPRGASIDYIEGVGCNMATDSGLPLHRRAPWAATPQTYESTHDGGYQE